MGQIAVILDPAGGVAEVRIIPAPGTRFADPALFKFASRLGPVLRALDEALLNHLVEDPTGRGKQSAGLP